MGKDSKTSTRVENSTEWISAPCNSTDGDTLNLPHLADGNNLKVPLTDRRRVIPCKFFSKGHCALGGACKFEHSLRKDLVTNKKFDSGIIKYGIRNEQNCESKDMMTTLGLKNPVTHPTTHGTDDLVSFNLEQDMLPSDLLADLMINEGSADNVIDQVPLSFAESIRRGGIPTNYMSKLSPKQTSTLSLSSTPIFSDETGITNFPITTVLLSGNRLQKTNELCPFAMVGKCRFGDLCRNVHGLQCPRCLRYCLYPSDIDKNEQHIEECLSKPYDGSCLNFNIDELECGICLERITLKEDPRFGLLNCDHTFCLSCIRQWRSKHSINDIATRSCPLCRIVTYFIIPSSTWATDPVEKQKIIDAYKKKLGEIDCKYFNRGDTTCPFGTSCFYAHRYRDGSKYQPIIRAIVDKDEQIRPVRETKLCDFIEFQIKQPKTK